MQSSTRSQLASTAFFCNLAQWNEKNIKPSPQLILQGRTEGYMRNALQVAEKSAPYYSALVVGLDCPRIHPLTQLEAQDALYRVALTVNV
jgi:hypothetical protein